MPRPTLVPLFTITGLVTISTQSADAVEGSLFFFKKSLMIAVVVGMFPKCDWLLADKRPDKADKGLLMAPGVTGRGGILPLRLFLLCIQHS